MFTSLERYIPLFENYLLSKDKTDFIRTRNDPVEKSLLELLTEPITSINAFREKMQKASLNYSLQNELVDYKLFSYIQSAKALDNDVLFIDLKKKYSSGNFEYSRPATLNAQGPKEGQEKSSASQIVLSKSLEQYLSQKKNSNPQFIRSLNDHALSKVPASTLLNLSVSDKEYLLEKFTAIFHMDDHFLSKFLIEFQKEKKKTNESYRLTNKILSLLTKKQLITLGESYENHQAFNNEDYIDLWFNQLYAETIRKHVEESNTFTKTEHKNKRDAFLKIVTELEKLGHYTIIKRYVNKLKSEILVLDTLVGEPNLERLFDYLSTSQVGFQLNFVHKDFYDELRQNQRQLVQDPRMRYQLQVDKTSPTAFVEQYIELLFKKNQEVQPIIKKLNRFIEENYLRKISVKVRLYKGEAIQNVSDYFSQQELQSMKDRKEIKLHSTNSKKFGVQDDVVLDVSIKNVKRINIKVYVLNLEKHLLGESCNYNLNDEIELSFLIPTAEKIYESGTSNPFEILDTQINLNQLIPKTMGVYIVDFQGETVTSRAVIRKGTIICVDTFTEAGQQFSFFDQNGKPLGEANGLKVWIRGQITNLIDNKAFVTYSDQTEYGTIVAAVGDYAESFQKKFEEERYRFDVGYIYNTESFIVGRKAKIILHGRLSMNGKSMNLQLLKNTKVTVTVTNNQDIKTTFPYQIEKWTNFEDQVIEFPIQAYTKQINISVQSQISLQNKKDFNLTSSKDISIDLGENSTNFVDFYLEQDQYNHYKLSLLGANGEPIANADVVISLNIAGVKEPQRKTVKTNNEGLINLGHLLIVKRLTALIRNSQSSIERSWQIDQTENNFNYNNTIHFKLGHALTLPVSNKWKNGDVLFLRTFDKYCAEDLTSKLSIQKGVLKLPVINEEGFYILKMLPIDKSIEIITLKNIKWEDDNIENQKVYDEADGTVYEINKNIYQSLAIENVEFKPHESFIDAKITLNLGELPEDRLKEVRVHVLANNFISSDVRDAFKPDGFNVQATLGEHYVQPKRSAYYSNKTFSEEGAYVWNRQSKNEQLIGNNLEKPSIFLKRIQVRETTQNKEELHDEGKYIEECAVMDVDPNMRERFRARKPSGAGSPEAPRNALNLNSHNNFLLLSGDLAKNLNGKSINFTIPAGYNSVEVYVLTPKTALKNTYSIGSNRPHLQKDLRHTGLEETEEKYGWTMSREINSLKANDKRIVSRNSQWRTVGLSDIFEFANNKKIKLYDWSGHLLNWSSYSEEKKRQIYDKQCCHELNTFIKFKDPKFFDGVVANFIRNKIQKNVVDDCLLNDPNYLTYATLSKLNTLNAFEKALLVYTLTQNGKQDNARSIVQSMQLVQKSIKRNYQEYKNSFDTIINAKQQEQRPKREQRAMMEASYSTKMSKLGGARKMMMKQSEPRMHMMRMMDMREQRKEEKRAFVPIESTKEYTERTYYNVKDYRAQAPRLVQPSRFWAQVARNFLNGSTELTSDTFMYLKTPIDFILASSFISSESSSNYELSNAGDNYEIHPKSPMLLYVKQVKKVEYAKKFGVLINQRFFDPNNRKAYDEDGTEYDREVQEFIVKKCYICQTVVNNTSGTPLELQVLLDIPRGTIPLRSHEYTQIINISIPPYSSQSFERYFYIPEEGKYEIYPSNASRGSTIIAKANVVPPITAKKVWSINKLESFEDILRSGDKDQVITFLEKRNIFDPNIFKPTEILWMLKEKDFYYKIIDILRKRSYFNTSIWEFAFLHNDLPTIQEFISQNSNQTTFTPISFEYFPYYSSRTHQFANESKSTIRNVQFKETYLRFLIGSTVGLKQESFEVSYCYYLILQDRLRDANEIIRHLTPEQLKAHEIQFDYMKCFLDLSLNAPNFNIAREIVKKYDGYPVESWRKLFADVKNTIEAEDSDYAAELEKENIEAFQTQVIQEGSQFKIIQPAETTIKVEIFQINLELYFSEYPFIEIKTFTSVKPSLVNFIEPSNQTREYIIKRSEYEHLKDATVQVTEFRNGLPPKKVSSFWWTNPDIKVKVNDAQGTLQVYLSKRRLPGAYVKVFADKGFNKEFYRDGYTDMTGTFRYAMSDLDGIKEFSILVMTDKGGVIQKVKPPSKLGSF